MPRQVGLREKASATARLRVIELPIVSRESVSGEPWNQAPSSRWAGMSEMVKLAGCSSVMWA